MTIFGAELSPEWKLAKEAGFFGSRDVLTGGTSRVMRSSTSIFGKSDSWITKEHKLYLHIPTNAWTVFTGKLREYCLPWRWKTVYLESSDSAPRQVLVCASGDGVSDRLKKLMGQSWLVTNLIREERYEEVLGKECMVLPSPNPNNITKIVHPLGARWGVSLIASPSTYHHIYRARSLFSTICYHFLKRFTASWKEAAIQVAGVSEKVLIKRSDEAVLSGARFIKQT